MRCAPQVSRIIPDCAARLTRDKQETPRMRGFLVWGKLDSRLLHRVDHVEDRQVHRDHHAADDDAEEHDHDGFEQREKVADRCVYLFIIFDSATSS
jgi:hypothetical protein